MTTAPVRPPFDPEPAAVLLEDIAYATGLCWLRRVARF